MKRILTPDFLVFFIGLLIFSAGIYLIYPPGALVGSGAILMVISLFGRNTP